MQQSSIKKFTRLNSECGSSRRWQLLLSLLNNILWSNTSLKTTWRKMCRLILMIGFLMNVPVSSHQELLILSQINHYKYESHYETIFAFVSHYFPLNEV